MAENSGSENIRVKDQKAITDWQRAMKTNPTLISPVQYAMLREINALRNDLAIVVDNLHLARGILKRIRDSHAPGSPAYKMAKEGVGEDG